MHINKREDTVCQPKGQKAAFSATAGFEDSRNLLKIHRPAPNGVFGWAGRRTGTEEEGEGTVGHRGRKRMDWQTVDGLGKKGSELQRRQRPHEFASFSQSFRLVPAHALRLACSRKAMRRFLRRTGGTVRWRAADTIEWGSFGES